MEVAEETLIIVASIPANLTEFTEVKAVPFKVTLAPTDPIVGVKEDKEGF